MMELMLMFCLIYFSGFISFVKNRKHFLLLLLSLEMLSVSLIFGLSLIYSFNFNNFFICLIFLVMAVCEGVLGLSVMVLMIRCFGNDYMMNLSMLW
uniref:NADH-ubiquinone oxidoreductase chain 4L n=1 Tax=Imatidium capense TaxID=294609 RepID=U3KZS7_9CUCU|nr:NADH dehydrogenase subunit 4L [Imatidium capense]